MAARKIVRRSCLGARPRYNLVVDEDVKKPNKQTKICSYVRGGIQTPNNVTKTTSTTTPAATRTETITKATAAAARTAAPSWKKQHQN